MVIKVSAAAEVRALVRTLAAADEVAREGAVARLGVIGPRVVPHLVAAYRATTDRAVRAAMLRAMEPTGDPRAAAMAREAIREGGDVAVAAASVLRQFLDSADGGTASGALDALMSTALHPGAERRVRIAAIDALGPLAAEMKQALAAAVGAGDDPAHGPPPTQGSPADAESRAIWKDSLDGHLPDDPGLLRKAVALNGTSAALSDLRRLVDRIRTREAESPAHASGEWRAVRGSIHQALAWRGSRVALYDLRETLESATAQLPPSFAAAVQALGDSSCLDAIAAAYSRSAPEADRWRHLLAAAFKAIASRERVTRRHAVIKRISSRWPDASARLTRQ